MGGTQKCETGKRTRTHVNTCASVAPVLGNLSSGSRSPRMIVASAPPVDSMTIAFSQTTGCGYAVGRGGGPFALRAGTNADVSPLVATSMALESSFGVAPQSVRVIRAIASRNRQRLHCEAAERKAHPTRHRFKGTSVISVTKQPTTDNTEATLAHTRKMRFN